MSNQVSIITVQQLMDQVSISDLYPQFISQLQKDINRAGIDYEINRQSKPKELYLEIEKVLLDKLNNAFNEYLNLLYAVDVSEKDIRNFQSLESADIAKYAAFLILKREWQKVYFRNKS